MTDSIESINRWQALARPEPTPRDLTIALAVMAEEITELMASFYLSRRGTYAFQAMHEWSQALKAQEDTAIVKDRIGCIDGLADVIVTAVGVGHCAGMDVPRALAIVSESNWSKCVNGQFVKNDQGKIIKPPEYFKPQLEGCV